MAVRDEQSDEGDHDGRDRYPEPGALLSKYVHNCFAEYSNDGVPGSEFLIPGLRIRRKSTFRLQQVQGIPSARRDFGIFCDGLESVDAEGFDD